MSEQQLVRIVREYVLPEAAVQAAAAVVQELDRLETERGLRGARRHVRVARAATVEVPVRGCARCGDDHAQVAFTPLTRPVPSDRLGGPEWTQWGALSGDGRADPAGAHPWPGCR
jgi:hypothetical protein